MFQNAKKSGTTALTVVALVFGLTSTANSAAPIERKLRSGESAEVICPPTGDCVVTYVAPRPAPPPTAATLARTFWPIAGAEAGWFYLPGPEADAIAAFASLGLRLRLIGPVFGQVEALSGGARWMGSSQFFFGSRAFIGVRFWKLNAGVGYQYTGASGTYGATLQAHAAVLTTSFMAHERVEVVLNGTVGKGRTSVDAEILRNGTPVPFVEESSGFVGGITAGVKVKW